MISSTRAEAGSTAGCAPSTESVYGPQNPTATKQPSNNIMPCAPPLAVIPPLRAPVNNTELINNFDVSGINIEGIIDMSELDTNNTAQYIELTNVNTTAPIPPTITIPDTPISPNPTEWEMYFRALDVQEQFPD